MRLTTVATATLLLLVGCGAPAVVEPVHVRTIAPAITTSTTSSTTSTSTPSTVPRETSTTSTPPRRTVHAAAATVVVVTPSATPTGTPSPLLRRIGGCESSGSANGPLLWTKQNPHSTASGAFQDLDSTWLSWARRYGGDVGASSYSRAMYAPPDVQITVNERALEAGGTAPWASSRGCWG